MLEPCDWETVTHGSEGGFGNGDIPFLPDNYGAKVKAEKLAPIVRGWRNYHRFCKMDGSRFSLWHINNRAFKVFNKEKKQNKHSTRKLIEIAFPAVPYSENKHINLKGNKSPYDGDLTKRERT